MYVLELFNLFNCLLIATFVHSFTGCGSSFVVWGQRIAKLPVWVPQPLPLLAHLSITMCYKLHLSFLLFSSSLSAVFVSFHRAAHFLSAFFHTAASSDFQPRNPRHQKFIELGEERRHTRSRLSNSPSLPLFLPLVFCLLSSYLFVKPTRPPFATSFSHCMPPPLPFISLSTPPSVTVAIFSHRGRLVTAVPSPAPSFPCRCLTLSTSRWRWLLLLMPLQRFQVMNKREMVGGWWGGDERGRDRNGVKEASVKRVDVGRFSCAAWQLDCVTHVCSLCWEGHPTHAQTDFQENTQTQVHTYT